MRICRLWSTSWPPATGTRTSLISRGKVPMSSIRRVAVAWPPGRVASGLPPLPPYVGIRASAIQ